MTRYNRRTLLKASAAFAGASALGFPAISYGQSDKIKIGHLTPLTGFLGALGISGPIWRMTDQAIQARAKIVKAAANRLSAEFGASAVAKSL